MKLVRLAWGTLWLLTVGIIAAAPQAKPGPDQSKDQDEPPAKIEGIEIDRPNGTYMGLQIKDNNFVLTFYDKKKKKTAPDVSSAVVRWPVNYQKTDERTQLTPGGDGKSLSSALFVRYPHTFKVSLLLFVEGQQDAVETYDVDYHD